MKEPPETNRQPDKLEEALSAFYQVPLPPEAFVERLEQQLRAHHPALTHQQPPATSAWSRFNPFRSSSMLKQHTRSFVSGVVGLALLFALIVGAMALFSRVSQSTAIDGTPAPIGPQLKLSATPRRTDDLPSPLGPTPTPSGPQLQLQGTGKLPDRFGRPEGSQIPLPMSVRVPQPDFPEQVALYTVHTGFEPPSVEVVRRWAEQFGLKSVHVYRNDPQAVEDTGTSGTYIAQSADGREVSLNGERVTYTSLLYDLPTESSNTSIAPDVAAATAESFLKSIPNLIVVEGNSQVVIDHHVELLPQMHTPGMLFLWKPTINGIPLLVNEGQVLVDYNGQVRYATFAPMSLKLRNKTMTPRPVETALQELVNDDPVGILQASWDRTDTEAVSKFQQFHRTSALAVGDEVVAYGYVLHRWAIDGGSDQFILWGGGNGTHDFVLETDGPDLAQPVFRRGATVAGRLIGQLRPGLWRVQVSKIERYPDGFNDVYESMGIVRREPTGIWLEADSGHRYLLPDVPTDLPDGAYIYAPGVYVRSDNQTLRLEWEIMQQDGMLSTSAVASIMKGPSMVSKSGEAFQTAGPSGITPTLPAWWTYKPGDEVTLEGELAMSGYRTQGAPSSDQTATPASERVVFDATLLTHSAKDLAAARAPVTLVGNQVNLDLLRLSGFSVRVQGRLLTAKEIAEQFPDLGLGAAAVVEITRYERLYPAEVKAILSGGVRVATVGDRRVAIISDAISQREYVLSDSLTDPETLPSYESMIGLKYTLCTSGITAPDQIYGGYPIIRGVESYTGRSEITETVQYLRDRLENPVQDLRAMPAENPTDVVFDQIELAYTPWAGDAIKPIVIYHLTGHSSDNRYTLTYYLRASAEPQP